MNLSEKLAEADGAAALPARDDPQQY